MNEATEFTEADAERALENVRTRREAIENVRLGHKTSAQIKAALGHPGARPGVSGQFTEASAGAALQAARERRTGVVHADDASKFQTASADAQDKPARRFTLAGPGQRAALAGTGRSGLIAAY
jgi:hypothetical protein